MWSVPSVCLVQTRRLYRRPTAYKGVFSVNEFLSIKTILGALCLVSNSPNCIIQKVVKSVHLIGVSAVIAQSFFHLKYFEFSENKRRYRCLNLLNTATMATKVLQLETLWVTWHFGLLEKKNKISHRNVPRDCLFMRGYDWQMSRLTGIPLRAKHGETSGQRAQTPC